MKSLMCALVLLLAATLRADDKTIVKNVRRHYTIVNRKLPRYRCVRQSIVNYSTEGALLEAYFATREPLKISFEVYGCTSQIHSEYYFWNNHLDFILETRIRYQSLASSKIRRRTESRFYFHHGRLARWIGADGKSVETTNHSAKIEEAYRLLDTRKTLALAQAARRSGLKEWEYPGPK